MISRRKGLLRAALSLLLVLSLMATGMPVFAISAQDLVTTSDDPFAYAPVWKGQTSQASADTWQFLQPIFGVTDLTAATHLAIQIKVVKGNFGVTVGAHTQEGGRYATYGAKTAGAKLLRTDGTSKDLDILYDSITLNQGDEGILILPMDSLSWVGWNSADQKNMARVNSVFFETNALYNFAFELAIGEIGYYVGTPGTADARYTKLMETVGSKSSDYYISNSTLEIPEVQIPVAPPSELYPFGDFANAPTWKGKTEQTSGDAYQFLQPQFSVADLTAATHLAIQIKLAKGNFGMTVGTHTSNGGRYGTFVDKTAAVKLVRPDGSSKDLDILYGSITLTEGDEGMLLIPMANLAWVGWAGAEQRNLAIINSVFFETNARYNFGFELVVGEVGYYVGTPGESGSTYTELLDLSAGEKKGSYYVAESTLEFPSDVEAPAVMPETHTYPFAKGENAFQNAVIWAGTAVGDANDNWQTFKLNFDSAADLSEATWLVLQYKALGGAPGITYGLQKGDARYSIVGHDGTKTYMISEDGKVTQASAYQFDASNVGGTGALLINLKEMGWQFGSEANKDLSKMESLILTTNSKYNWNFEIAIGEVGYYTGTIGKDAEYHVLVDTSAGNKLANASATSDNAANRGTVRAVKVDRTQYGSVLLNWLATGKTGASFQIWDGGSFGTATMVQDSYGDDAVQLTATGANPNGDQYVATTIGDGLRWEWGGSKGVTLWARNDSTAEISFNLEIDICNNEYKNTAGGHNARFNVKQGHRFILFDVNTGKQTIYMTRPCVTLPVGFEGWVFVPFTAFSQADWSVSGQGAMAASLFLDDENRFNANSWVSYVATTVHAPSYQNQAFSLNKIGSYTVTPSFVSDLIQESDTIKSVPTLMELPKEEK